MQVTDVRTQLYEIDLTRPLADANGPHGRQRMASLAVFLDTDDGLTGLSLGSPGAEAQIHSLARGLIIGHDPRGVRGLWADMIDAVFKGGNEGLMSGVVSCLDVALWDLKAKANDEPLWKTLGASTPRVRAYASGIDLSLSNTELWTFYEGMAAQGICGGKLKVGLDIEADLERIAVMRDALATSGKTPELMIDSNEYWSPKQAIRYISTFERHLDITWVEEPARRWDYAGLKKVSDSVRAAVATGENLHQISDYTRLIANHAADIIQVGLGASGITGALQIADLAYAFDVPVSLMNCPANYSAHLAAALPNHIGMEVLDAGRDAVFLTDSHIEDGWIVLGNKPGLGIAFDEEAFATAAVDALPPNPWSGTWGRRRGAGLYLVGPQEPDRLPSE